MKLLIDVSSVMWMCLLAGKDKEFGQEVEHEGKTVQVNGWQFGYDNAVNHITSVMKVLDLVPIDLIFVVEGEYAKSKRKVIYSGYKEERGSRPPEAYVEFGKAREALTGAFRNVGAQSVSQVGVEADDMLAYLARNIEGEIVILTNDGDMTTLIDERVSLWQAGALTKRNKYGPFPHRYVPVYKALVGDGNEYKGAKGFGDKAFLDMLVWLGNDSGLAALEGMMQRGYAVLDQAHKTPGTLIDLEEDVASFKPFRKVIDGARHVYESYQCALLHDEWCDTERTPVVMLLGQPAGQRHADDHRLTQWVGTESGDTGWWEKLHPAPVKKTLHCVFDIELIGRLDPVFLVCSRIIETGESASFWHHVEGDMGALHAMLKREEITWVSFNGIHFDAPLISAAIDGKDTLTLKQMANALIIEGAKAWDLPGQYDFTPLKFDHIDLIEVAPGVRTSLKAYAGRMGYPTMVDLPFHHDQDLGEEECAVLESYCRNDLGVTEALFKRLKSEIELREELSAEHGIDLRSKSDAQVAETILRKAARIGRGSGDIPAFVKYSTPDFIKTESDVINDLVARLERTQFTIHRGNGQVEAPEFLREQLQIGEGTYQCGVGGLHSTHDKRLHAEASEEMLISDFDVASYYPNIMLKAGLTPNLGGDSGSKFIDEYRHIYDRRMEAKHAGNLKVANALKISLNGTFGKLGSMFSAFYAPDLMLAVTLTGQLNLLCLIYDFECRQSIRVLSANTDGVTVMYPARLRQLILDKVEANAKRTGFEYEETRYRTIAMKDVNNYLAVTLEGKVKRKGLYAEKGLMKNPTMQVCSDMAAAYLRDGVHPLDEIARHTDITDFVAIRVVKGGGIQHDAYVHVDDWVLTNDVGSKDNEWMRQAWLDAGIERAPVKRKSRPKPVDIGLGGEPFGRIARWYMCNSSQMPINYLGSGNKVPKTDGAKVCMTLPDGLPDDLDREWYIAETLSMLEDMGVVVTDPVIEETLELAAA